MSILAQMIADASALGVDADELERQRRHETSAVTDVPATPEFARVRDLGRRSVEVPIIDVITPSLSRGRMVLRPNQARALTELYQCAGAFAPIAVGGGKTLISYLAPLVTGAKRPLLVIPADLREKTRREFRALALAWDGPDPDAYRIESYETLGRANAGAHFAADGSVERVGLLEAYCPDLIVLDEAHKAKNPSAAVTRRLKRYAKAVGSACKWLIMTGTISKRSIHDYAHLLDWALGDKAPVPRRYIDLEHWGRALDEKVTERIGAGALRDLCDDQERREGLAGVRRGFRRRLTESPGVIASRDGELGVSLRIAEVSCDLGPQVDRDFARLRAAWETPDGEPIADGIAIYRHARELALGFYYRWNPRPPDAWLDARRVWNSLARSTIRTNRKGIDSELQLCRAVDQGLYPDLVDPLRAWRGIRDTFTPNTEAVWISDSVIQLATQWAHHAKDGLIWTEHVAFAERLAEVTGFPYFGAGGVDASGTPIESTKAPIAIASVASNGKGRNLQRWCRNLVISAPPNGVAWEQLIGRTHRSGQAADRVDVSVYLGCAEGLEGFAQAQRDARYASDITGQIQRLSYADTILIEHHPQGPRWTKGNR